MAIYSLHLGFVSRSEGRSSVGFAAYIAGEKAFDERTGRTFNFSHKANEVLVSNILLPEGAPAWMNDRETFWNAVEKFEDHIADLRFQGGEKSQLAKEKFINSAQSSQTGMGAIPIELTKDQAEKCVKEFLETCFVSRKLGVDYAIHWEEGNPHFHAMITRRAIENGTFSHRKDRELVSKAEVIQTRKVWEQVANKHLEMAGHEARIDARSNAARGSFFMATEHEGWHAQRLAEEGKYTRIVHENEQVRQKNIQLIAEKPETLIHELTLKRTTFTQKHVEDEIIKRVGGDEKLFEILRDGLRAQNIDGISEKSDLPEMTRHLTAHLLRDENITHKAGENIDREQIYTSQTYKEHEERIVSCADALNGRSRSLDVRLIDRSIAKLEAELNKNRAEGEPLRQLSDEQKIAVYHLCSGSDIRLLNGRAGTGKTTLLKAVAESYQAAGYEVIGTSFQGKAVEIMQKEIGIPCRTLDSFIYHWKKHAEKKAAVESGKLWGEDYLKEHRKMKQLEKHFFHKKSVIIVDEANMIGGNLWEWFLTEATSRGAKVLGVQDPAQIKSRDPGDVGRLLSERFGAAEVSTVMRQRVSWQARCSEHLNDHQVLNGLKSYQEKGHLQWFENDHQAREKLSADFVKAYRQNPTQIALAYTNEEVDSLNRSIRVILKEEGLLGKQMTFKETEYAVGDKIRFTENDNHGQFVQTLPRSFRDLFTTEKGAGVKNGSIGRIDSIRSSKIVVNLEDGRRVSFNPHAYDKFTHGYAMTVNKSEGSTVDGTFVLPSRQMDPHTTLVSMTRHREDVQMYVSRETFVDFKDLVDTLSKGHFHETLQDYKVTETQQPYLDRVRQYKDLLIEAVTLREEMEGSLKPNEPLYKHKSYESYQLCFEQKKETAELILKEWSHHKPFTRLAGIRKDVLEVEVGLRPRLLSDLEQRASIQVEGYKDTVRTASALWEVIQKTHPSSLSTDHNLYAQYDALRQERDSIASEFKNAPKLYQQFFREEDRQKKVYWAAVTSHAQAWEKRCDETVYVGRLSVHGKESYDLLKSYKEAQSQAGVLYGTLREETIDATSELRQSWEKQLKEKTILRDTLAVKVFRDLEDCSKHFERMGIDEDKLLKYAVQGEVREVAQNYLESKDFSQRSEAAQYLQESLKDKHHYWIVKEAGIDLQRVRFDIAFGEALRSEIVQPSANVEEIYPLIQQYLSAHQQTGKIWGLVKEEGEAHKEAAALAFETRDACAKEILENSDAKAVFGLLRPNLVDKLPSQADRAHLRELCKLYASELDPSLKAERAQSLQTGLQDKSLYYVMKASGLDLPRVRFDIALRVATLKGEVSSTSDQEKLYTHVQGYITIQQEAAKLWKLANEGEKLPAHKEAAVLAFEKRDAYAKEIFENPESKAVLTLLRPSLTNNLQLQASKMEVRELCKEYKAQTETPSRIEKATDLNESLHDKSHFRIVKESGIEIQKIRFESAFGKAVHKKMISFDTDPDKIYPQVQEYLGLHRNACKLWRRFKEGEEGLRGEAITAFEKRDGFLQKAADQKEVQDVLSILNPRLVPRSEKTVAEPEKLPSDTLEKRKAHFFSTDQILHEARHQYDSLARSLLGQENKHMSNANTLRFGKKGSMSLNIGGTKAGSWYDFSTGEGGNIFSLVQRERGCNFKESIEYLGQHLGLVPGHTFKENLKKPVEKIKEEKVESDAEKIMKIAAVQALYKESKTLREGNVALNYLRSERKIMTAICDDLREIPKGTRFIYQGKERTLAHTCLAAFGRDKDGTLLSVQLTKLKEDGTRATLQTGEKLAKIKYGIGKEAFVTLQSKPESQTVIIAEGVETALSIKETGIDATIVAAQGIHNIKNYQGSEKHIVLAADNDDHKPNSGTHKVIAQAQEHFKAQGNDVTMIKPQTPGDDFNDVLKKQGVDGVKDHLKNIGTQMETKIDTVAKETNTFQNLSFKEKARILREQRTGRSSQNDKSTGIEWD